MKVKLSKERDSLAITANKLSRDLSKFETFKRHLMQSLSDDNASQAETVDIRTHDQSVPKAYPGKDDGISASTHSSNGLMGMGNTFDEATRHAGQRLSITPYITPRLSPTGTPKIISTVSPRNRSAVQSLQRSSASMSPRKPSYDGRTSLSSWYPLSQQSSRANSPPRGHSLPVRTPRIDGKEFFRRVRSRLSYEQFSAFLANIKELNAQKQTREDTLRKSEEIFGTDNKDVFLSFQGLLNRNIH